MQGRRYEDWQLRFPVSARDHQAVEAAARHSRQQSTALPEWRPLTTGIGALAFIFALLCAPVTLLSEGQLTWTVTRQRCPRLQPPPPFAVQNCSTALSVA